MKDIDLYILTKDVLGFSKGTWFERHPSGSESYRVAGTEYGGYIILPDGVLEYQHSIVKKSKKDQPKSSRDTIPLKDTQQLKGIKDDSGKTQWWYMDNFWPDLEQVADVLTYGDSKYPADDGANWKRLDNPEQRLCDALLRHVLKYRYESKDDPETGKSHLAHAITNALMLMYFDRNKKGK